MQTVLPHFVQAKEHPPVHLGEWTVKPQSLQASDEDSIGWRQMRQCFGSFLLAWGLDMVAAGGEMFDVVNPGPIYNNNHRVPFSWI